MSTKKDTKAESAIKPLDASIFAKREAEPQIDPSKVDRVQIVIRTAFLNAAILAMFQLKEFATLFISRLKETGEAIQVDLQSLRIYLAEAAEFCNDEGISAGKAVTFTTAVPPGQNVFVRTADGREISYNPRDAGFNMTKAVRPVLLTFPEACEDLAKFGVDVASLQDELLTGREQALVARRQRHTRRAVQAGRQQQRAPQGRRPDVQYEDSPQTGEYDANISDV